MNQTKRLYYFDTAKGIGVFLVLLGHLQGDTVFALSPHILTLCTWIFSFHMPLFFLIAGMLIRYKNDRERDWSYLLQRRFKGIMIPYLWFSLFYFLVVLVAFIKGSIQPETLFVQLWYVVGLYGMNVLWFLPALFLGELLFLLILKNHTGRQSALVVALLTLVAIGLNYLLQSATYDAPILERLHELAITILRPVFVTSFLGIGYFLFGFFKHEKKFYPVEFIIGLLLFVANIFLFPINGGVDFRSLVQGNVLLYYLCALLGSVGLILLCKNQPNCKPITFWGSNSLIVMAVHNNESVLYLALKLSMYVNQFLTRARGYICYAIIVLVIVIFTTLMIFLINRFFGFIVSKPSPFDPLIAKLHRKDNS